MAHLTNAAAGTMMLAAAMIASCKAEPAKPPVSAGLAELQASIAAAHHHPTLVAREQAAAQAAKAAKRAARK